MNRNIEDIYILHLSDLHIKNENQGSSPRVFYSKALTNLIIDIAEQIDNKENVIMVISGDIIDQGNYEIHKDVAIKFFKDLYKNTKGKIQDIIIVPGNHDKCRNRVNTLVSRSHAEVGLEPDELGSCDSTTEWKVHLDAYKPFLELTNEIYKIFGLDKTVEDTFGIDIVSGKDSNICFIRLDSAWCSHSENDYRKLRISKYQLSKLHNEYLLCRNLGDSNASPIDLTIAISHYPLNWLTVDEEELCNSYFLSDEYLDVDILMCGHVHNFSAVNLFNHDHSLLTLVTGIGWGTRSPNEDKCVHRYSLYSLNLFYNSCDIVMRKTKSNGSYDFDYSVYIGEDEVKDNKLRFPLKGKARNAFIRINAPKTIETKSLFVDNSLISTIPKVTKAIVLFSENMAHIFERYKDHFFATIKENISYSSPEEDIDKVLKQIEGYLYKGRELSPDAKSRYFSEIKNTFDVFLAYLREICVYAVADLASCFSANCYLRAHFRWHECSVKQGKIQNDKYCLLCQWSNPDKQQSDSMQSIPWGGLIKPAFETYAPLVFSANKKYNPIVTAWDDFITIVPRFIGSSYDVRMRKGVNESRPILTFGLSIKNIVHRTDTISLHLLAYLGFDDVLAQIIDEYINLFNVDVKVFLTKIQELKEKDSTPVLVDRGI